MSACRSVMAGMQNVSGPMEGGAQKLAVIVVAANFICDCKMITTENCNTNKVSLALSEQL